MWVDLTNLKGPRGEDGKDGPQGPPGPVNIGLRQDDPINWDQSGGFTFNLVDGSSQTVNLPIASAQSAGLLSAGGSLPATSAVDLSASILTGRGWDLALSPSVEVFRAGPIVTLNARNIGRTAAAVSYNSLLTLPSAYRPPADIYDESLYAKIRVTPGGTVSVLDPGTAADFFTATYVTRNAMP